MRRQTPDTTSYLQWMMFSKSNENVLSYRLRWTIAVVLKILSPYSRNLEPWTKIPGQARSYYLVSIWAYFSTADCTLWQYERETSTECKDLLTCGRRPVKMMMMMMTVEVLVVSALLIVVAAAAAVVY